MASSHARNRPKSTACFVFVALLQIVSWLW